MSGFIGAGNVLLNRFDPVTDLPQGWTDPLEASLFSIQAKSNLKELKSKSRDNYGSTIGSVSIPDGSEFKVTLRDITKDTFGFLFLGSISTIAQVSSTVVDETITMTLGYGTSASKRNIGTPVLTSKPAGTTYVLGTDYTLDGRNGIVRPVAGSSLATAIAAAPGGRLDVLLDYAVLPINGSRITGNNTPRLVCSVIFDGKNLESGKLARSEIARVVLTPSAGFDFLADDWNEVPLDGRIVKVPGATGDFFTDLPDA